MYPILWIDPGANTQDFRANRFKIASGVSVDSIPHGEGGVPGFLKMVATYERPAFF